MILEQAKEELIKTLDKITGKDTRNSIAITKDPTFGNFETRISFEIAKAKKSNPASVAVEIAKNFNKEKSNLIEKAEAKGPYVNFFLSPKYYKGVVIEEITAIKRKNKKAIVESPAVNPNKPWHIGHLRNAILGNTIANLLEFTGYDVERADYIDNLGLQVAQSLWYYMKFQSSAKEKFDLFVGKQYVEATNLLETNEKEIRTVLEKMEKEEGDIAKKADEFVEKVVLSQNETGFNYDIFHDYMVFESTIVKDLLPIGLKMLTENGALRKETAGKNAGCFVLSLSGDEFAGQLETDKILIRSDGTTTYTGKDIVFNLWKFGIFEKELSFRKMFTQPKGKICYRSFKTGDQMEFGKADLVVNIIGVEQTHPQNVVKYAIRKLGYTKQADNYVHVAYGTVKLPEGNFSGRKGIWIGYTADDLFEEGMKKVKEKMKKFDENERKKVFNSAVKYSFLKVGASTEVTFDWNRALSMDGDSGPYLLYSFVRAKKILEKSEKEEAFGTYNQDEKDLIFKISQFTETVESASKQYEPCILATYLLELASMFHSYYAKYKVVDSEEEGTRKVIVKSFAHTMETGLGLLGIQVVEEM